MDTRPNINDDYDLEIAPQNNEQHREACQSIKLINKGGIKPGSLNAQDIFSIASQGKDAIVTSPSVRRNLIHTIKNITKLEITCPDQSKTKSLYDRTAHAWDRLDFGP